MRKQRERERERERERKMENTQIRAHGCHVIINIT